MKKIMKQIPMGEAPFSLGLHTFSLYCRLDRERSDELFRDFFDNCKTADSLLEYIPPDKKALGTKSYVFKYKQDVGIRWIFTSTETPIITDSGDRLKLRGLLVIINPKILAGTKDYITAANESDMFGIEERFNNESKKISEWLPPFYSYTISRIDYCINCNIRAALIGCTPEQMMMLIDRGDVPPHFKDQDYEGSFYLKCGCAHINCYAKDDKFYPDVIRLEIQCKAQKLRTISNSNKFSEEVCRDIIENYFYKTIGRGNYYTLANAIKMLQCQCLNTTNKNRLIHWLEFVNQCRGIAKAKARLKDNPKELEALKRALKHLHSFGINPVTIPKDWVIEKWRVNEFGIRYIPTLLNAYYETLAEERNKQREQQFRDEQLRKYLSKSQQKKWK